MVYLSLGYASKSQTIDITQPQVGGIAPPSGSVVAGITSGSPWLTNSQIPNKPSLVSIQRIIGTNLTEATYTSADPEHYTFLNNLSVIANEMRFFHLMDKDYLSGQTPTSLPDACASNLGAFTGGINCDGGGYTSMLNAFQNYKSIAAVTLNKDLYVNHSILKSFPDTWYTIEQWGGSFNNSTPGIATVTNIQQNARNYAKAFARSYCPDASHCIVKVLEVGNEPWGEPSWAGYREIFKGFCLGLQDIYGTNISGWPMKISIGAMQFFQNETVPINKTQRANLTAENKNKFSSDYAGYMIPAGYEQYISALNTHVYSVNNISYTIPSSTTTYYKEDDFSYIAKEPEASLSSFQKIKNMALWKNSGIFPNLNELNVTEFGWNSEDVTASKYFPPSTSNNQCQCNSPLKSIPLVGNVRTINNSTISDVSTNVTGTDWVYFVKDRTNSLESRGVGQKAQATYLIRSFLLLSRWGINKGFVYQSGDALTDAAYHHTGIISQKITPPNTNIFESTNLNNAFFDQKKKSYFALSKLRNYLGTGSAIAPVSTQKEKHFLYAIKEDSQAYIYVFGTKQPSGNSYIPTEIVAWSPANINDGEQFNIPLYNGVDEYSNTGKFCTRKVSSNNEFIDFTSNHTTNQLTATLSANLNIDASHNLAALQLDNSKNAILLDWNFASSGYTGSWQDATPNKLISEFVSGISGSNINFSKLTAIPVIIPISVPSGCVVNADGTTTGCGNAICTTPASPTVTASQSVSCNAIINLVATCATGTVQWTNYAVGQGTITPPTTANGAIPYSATCSNGTCVSPTSTSTVTVSGCGTTTCPITFNSFIQSTTTAIASCPSNGISYVLKFTANSNQSNLTVSITNLPANGASSQVSSPSGALNYATQTSFNWVIPTVTAGTVYTATMNYCFATPTPVTATYGSCSILSGSGTGCTTPTTPVLTVTPTTITSGQSSTLSATCNVGTASYYNASTSALLPSNIVSPTANTSYYAKCTNGTCVSANSNTVTVNVSSTCTPNAFSTNFLTATSGSKTFYISKNQAPFQSSGTAFDFANNNTVTGCKSIHSTARLVTITSAAENTAIKNVIASSTTSSGSFFIGYNSNASGVWSWLGGSSTYFPSGFSTTATANQATQLVTFTPGWAANGKNATSYFVCEIPCQNGSSSRVSANESVNNDEPETNLFVIYPNPTNDKLTVEYSLLQNQEISFGIIDMTGRTIQSILIDGKAGTHKFTMDVNRILEGSYIIRGISDDKTQARKFIIVR